MHGDTMWYPNTKVEVRVRPWIKRARVAIAPSLPVDVVAERLVRGWLGVGATIS